MFNASEINPPQWAQQIHLRRITADNAIRMGAVSWFFVALIGQWVFAAYVFAMYAIPVLSGHYENANRAGHITGYLQGDHIGNSLLFAHVLPAAMLSLSGILQWWPSMRRRFPRFHRWNGRLFFTFGLTGALTGLYLTWVRGSRLSDLGAIGISLNGLLIPIAIMLAWRAARARQFDAHKRWATHAFLLINGVWTFRLYLMAWYVLNAGPNGNNKTLDGPADLFITYACYLLPMCIAELIFFAQKSRLIMVKSIVAGLLFISVALTALGVIAATLMMWVPRMSYLFT